jgi:hypothetical protein
MREQQVGSEEQQAVAAAKHQSEANEQCELRNAHGAFPQQIIFALISQSVATDNSHAEQYSDDLLVVPALSIAIEKRGNIAIRDDDLNARKAFRQPKLYGTALPNLNCTGMDSNDATHDTESKQMSDETSKESGVSPGWYIDSLPEQVPVQLANHLHSLSRAVATQHDDLMAVIKLTNSLHENTQRQLTNLIEKIAVEKPLKMLNYDNPLIWIVISLISFIIIMFAIIIYVHKYCLEQVCCYNCRRAAEQRVIWEEILAVNLTRRTPTEQPVVAQPQEPTQIHLMQDNSEMPHIYQALELPVAIKTE